MLITRKFLNLVRLIGQRQLEEENSILLNVSSRKVAAFFAKISEH